MAASTGFLSNTNSNDSVFDHLRSKSSRKCFKNIYKYAIDTAKAMDEDRPFYIMDLADILWKTQLWKERLPNVSPYYAVKANADPVLMRLFVLLGYGFDCSTEGEIRLAIKSGADPRNIIFAHTIKTRKALRYASSIGVDLMTFDSKEELLKIRKEFPTARLIMRLKTESEQSIFNLNKKFGCDLTEGENLLLEAKNLNLNVVGVSFHVGALCESPDTYKSAIENSRLVFDSAERHGFKLSIVDIGAGFFGTAEKENFFCELVTEINKSLEANFLNEDIEIIAEPGCYCVLSAVSLVTSIIGKKTVLQNENYAERREYYLNDGFYGSFPYFFKAYDAKYIPVLPFSEVEKRQKYRSKIWGQTCCSEDIILEECLLPDMKEGEFIFWKNMGAYIRGTTSNFTLVPYPANQYVFIENPRLKLNCIPNLQEVSDYIADVADLIEYSQEMSDCSVNV